MGKEVAAVAVEVIELLEDRELHRGLIEPTQVRLVADRSQICSAVVHNDSPSARFSKGVGILGEGVPLRYTEIADRTARRDRLRRGDDGVGVNAIVPVEIGDRTGLAEMLDAKRPNLVAVHGAQPRQRRRMSVEHADDAAMWRQAGKQALDVGAGMHKSAVARAAGGGPRRG